MTPDLLSRLMRLPRFPLTARELVHVCGLDAAAALINEWPGLEFPMPAVEGGGNQAGCLRWEQLVEVVGEAAAVKLVRRYRGARLYVPSLRRVREDAERAGIHAEYERLVMAPLKYTHVQAISEIALKEKITSRCVEYRLAKPVVSEQGSEVRNPPCNL